MLVVCAIMAIITMVLLLRQSKFDSSTVMRSLAYSIALSVRQAQVYGTSVYNSGSASPAYASAYGIDLSLLSATTSSYTLFADLTNSGRYDPTNLSEAVKTFSLNNGYTISEVCAIVTASAADGSGGSRRCVGGVTVGGVSVDDTFNDGRIMTSLDIIFKRPNPDAVIVPLDSTGTILTSGGGLVAYSAGYIKIRSANGATRSIRISTTGLVTVEPPCTQVNTTVTSC